MSLTHVMRSEAALLLPTYERNPVLFERGRGVHLWDSEGKPICFSTNIKRSWRGV